jgi:hypothetical protein
MKIKFPKKKSLGVGDFTGESYQMFKEILTQIPHKRDCKKETFTNSFFGASITLMSNHSEIHTYENG